MTEKQIENQILSFLVKQPGMFVWKNFDQQAFRNGHYQKTAYTIRGIADITVLLPEGKTAWLEVKTPIGKQSIYQKRFQAQVEQLGHQYFIVRSLTQVKAILASGLLTNTK